MATKVNNVLASYIYNSNQNVLHIIVLIKRFIDFIYMQEAVCESYNLLKKDRSNPVKTVNPLRVKMGDWAWVLAMGSPGVYLIFIN